LKKALILILIISAFFSLCAVNFDSSESYERFKKGHSVGLSIFPVYEGNNTLLELDAFGSFYFDPLSFGFLIPVRFLLYNGDDIPTSASVFPEDDWDDARDWVALLNFFQYGYKTDLFYFRFAEAENRYVGNGTILGSYYNTLKLRFPKRSISMAFNTDYAGLDFFMDDVTPPNIIGGRAYIKPVSFFKKENYANNLELGFTYFADISAPYSIVIPKDENNNRVLEEASDQVFGFDISMRFVSLKYYKMKFYNEINHIVDAGTGLHFGLEHILTLPTATDMKFISRWEYRLMQSNYIPSYFNTFYDIQREYYRDGKTKSGFISDLSRDPDRFNLDWTHGYYFDLVFDITGKFSIGGSFEHNRIYTNDMKGKFNNFQITVFMNALFFKKLGADLVLTFEDIGESSLKDNPFFNISAYYLMSDYFRIGFYASSKWYLQKENKDQSTQYHYENTAAYSAGAYGILRF